MIIATFNVYGLDGNLNSSGIVVASTSSELCTKLSAKGIEFANKNLIVGNIRITEVSQ